MRPKILKKWKKLDWDFQKGESGEVAGGGEVGVEKSILWRRYGYFLELLIVTRV